MAVIRVTNFKGESLYVREVGPKLRHGFLLGRRELAKQFTQPEAEDAVTVFKMTDAYNQMVGTQYQFTFTIE